MVQRLSIEDALDLVDDGIGPGSAQSPTTLSAIAGASSDPTDNDLAFANGNSVAVYIDNTSAGTVVATISGGVTQYGPVEDVVYTFLPGTSTLIPFMSPAMYNQGVGGDVNINLDTIVGVKVLLIRLARRA